MNVYQGGRCHICGDMEAGARADDGGRVLFPPMGENDRYLTGAELASRVAAALERDERAWDALVTGLQRVVWKAVNMMTTDREIQADAFAATWLRLAERLATIREPEKLPGWLTTTATNEVRQILRQRGATDVPLSSLGGNDGAPGLLDSLAGDIGDRAGDLAAADDRRAVRAAFGRLDDGCRELITVLVLADPPVPYDVASEQLGRPVGSLGPTRGRCLDKLKNLLTTDPEPGIDSHG